MRNQVTFVSDGFVLTAKIVLSKECHQTE